MLASGMTDGAIAKSSGVSRCSVAQWRTRHGLPPSVGRNKPLDPGEDTKRRELYEQGLGDKAIAAALEMTPRAVWKWRRRSGLASNSERVQIKDPLVAAATPETRATCERLLRRNVTTKLVCAIFNLAASTVQRWRTEALRTEPGLRRPSTAQKMRPRATNGRLYSRLPPERLREAFELYALGHSDVIIAETMNLRSQQVGDWRSAYSLRPNARKRRLHGRRSAPSVPFQAIRTDRDLLYARIRRSLRGDWAIVDDAASDLYLAVIEGRLEIEQIEAVAALYRNRVIADYASAFGPVSLNKAVPGTEDLMMIDTLRDEGSSDWLEEMGATVW
jgi:transposase